MPPDSPALRLAQISREQHGAFSRPQALASGFTDTMILRRLRSGMWVRAHAGVYLDVSTSRTPEQEAMAACLACGDGAVASHLTAAALLGLDVSQPPLSEVTVPSGLQPRPSRIRVHRTRHLARYEVARFHGIPITSGIRMVADLAGVLDPTELEMVLDALWRRGSIGITRLAGYLGDRHQLSRPGTAVLRTLVAERMGQRPPGATWKPPTCRSSSPSRYRFPFGNSG